MKNAVKFFFTFFIGVSLFYFIINETGVDVIWRAINFFLRPEGAFIVLITLFSFLMASLRWREVIFSQQEKLPIFLLFRYLIKGFTIDFITPFPIVGGETVRALLVKRDIGLKKGAASAVIDKIIDITTHFFFLIIGLIFFVFYGKTFHSAFINYIILFAFFLFLLLGFFYFFALRKKTILKQIFKIPFFAKSKFFSNGDGQKVIEIEEEIVDFFSHRKRYLIRGVFFSFLKHFFLLGRVFFLLSLFNLNIGVAIFFIIYGFTVLSAIVPTPAAIGGMEAVMGICFGMLGFGFATGVIYAIVIRSADLFICLIGTTLFVRTFLIKKAGLFLGDSNSS